MKRFNLKIITLVLCLMVITLLFPQNTLALSTPSAPTNLTATAVNSNQIYLTWDTVSSSTGYYVYRATSPTGNYSIIATPTTAYYTDSGLSPSTPYYYKVQAANIVGVGSDSGIAYATTAGSSGLPSAPANLAATVASTSQITLTWNPVNYATNYYVYRSTSLSGPFSSIAVQTTTSYTDSGLSSSTVYYYKVLAVNSYGTSPDSSIVYANTTISASVPSVPSNLKATVASNTQIYLTWDTVSNATYYYVYRSTNPYASYSIVGVPTTSTYTDSSLSPYTTYYYKVQAVGSAGPSSDSAIVNATTVSSSSVLPAPTNLTATGISSNQIFLNWTPVSNATYYSVFRSASISGTYSIVGVPTTGTYTDSTVSSNTTYYYKVEAVGSNGTSSDSSIVNATTISNGALSAPSDVTAAVASSSQIYLAWDSVSNATNYYVYRSTSISGSYTTIAMPTTTNMTDSGLTPNTTYYYKVVAVGSAGTSTDSAIVNATTTVSNGTVAAPTDPTATALSPNQIYLTWDSVSDATSYYVYRASSSSDTYSNIATITTPYYTDSGLASNTVYYYKIQAVNSSGASSDSSITSTTTESDGNSAVNNSQIPSERLAGQDMYGTSAEVAKSGWKTSYYAIIVSGENFSDALCSAPLAQKYNAPLLLTGKDALNDDTKNQLSRLKVKNVIIVGGVGVISSAVEQTVKNMGIGVSRIAGNDSYETSIKIAQSMGQNDQAVVASGESFPDALSIAPIAAMKGIPIILTPKDNLPAIVKTYLTGIKSTYVVGGTGVISANLFNQLPSPKRLSGQNRYETNVSVIKEFASNLDFSTCYISTGENFADALAGAALATLTNSPVFLVSNPVDQSTVDYIKSLSGNIKKEVIFGGTVVVPDSILTSINGVSNGSTTLSAPVIVTASAVSSTQINLSWDSVNGATSYYIYGATSSSGTYSHIATVTSNTYVNTGLWTNTTYYYKIQAVNGSGTSEFSPIAYAKTTT
jgi:fibronectin type 3 domain-containing protein